MRARESEGERQGGVWRSVAWIRTKGGLQREAGGGARGGVAVSVLLAGGRRQGPGGGGLGRTGAGPVGR